MSESISSYELGFLYRLMDDKHRKRRKRREHEVGRCNYLHHIYSIVNDFYNPKFNFSYESEDGVLASYRSKSGEMDESDAYAVMWQMHYFRKKREKTQEIRNLVKTGDSAFFVLEGIKRLIDENQEKSRYTQDYAKRECKVANSVLEKIKESKFYGSQSCSYYVKIRGKQYGDLCYKTVEQFEMLVRDIRSGKVRVEVRDPDSSKFIEYLNADDLFEDVDSLWEWDKKVVRLKDSARHKLSVFYNPPVQDLQRDNEELDQTVGVLMENAVENGDENVENEYDECRYKISDLSVQDLQRDNEELDQTVGVLMENAVENGDENVENECAANSSKFCNPIVEAKGFVKS